MSKVGKAAKVSLVLFGVFVLLFVISAAYIYMNMGGIARYISERVATETLGVPVTIGKMDILVDEKKIIAKDIKIANPEGYTKPYAMSIETITVSADVFDNKLLSFARVDVEGTKVNLEVTNTGTNLAVIEANAHANASKSPAGEKDVKVIMKDIYVTKPQINPVVTLAQKDMAMVTAPDAQVSGIGVNEKGIPVDDALAQSFSGVVRSVHIAANDAGFLEGLPLEVLNVIGVSTVNVFQKNLQNSFNKEVEKFNQGVEEVGKEAEKAVEGVKGYFTE